MWLRTPITTPWIYGGSGLVVPSRDSSTHCTILEPAASLPRNAVATGPLQRMSAFQFSRQLQGLQERNAVNGTWRVHFAHSKMWWDTNHNEEELFWSGRFGPDCVFAVIPPALLALSRCMSFACYRCIYPSIFTSAKLSALCHCLSCRLASVCLIAVLTAQLAKLALDNTLLRKLRILHSKAW